MALTDDAPPSGHTFRLKSRMGTNPYAYGLLIGCFVVFFGAVGLVEYEFSGDPSRW